MSLSRAFDTVSYAIVVPISTKDGQQGSLICPVYSHRVFKALQRDHRFPKCQNYQKPEKFPRLKTSLQTQNLSFKQKVPAEIRCKTHRAELIWLGWGWQGLAEITYLLLKTLPLVIPLKHNHKTPQPPDNQVRK